MKQEKNKAMGKIVSIIGPIVDVEFKENNVMNTKVTIKLIFFNIWLVL